MSTCLNAVKHYIPDILERISNAKSQASEFYGVMKAPPYQEIDRGLARIEKFLNKSGYCPLTSSISGFVRVLLGLSELLIGGAGSLGHNVASRLASDEIEKEKLYKRATEEDLSYVYNGIKNCFRGYIEQIPFYGNTATTAYDLARHCVDEIS